MRPGLLKHERRADLAIYLWVDSTSRTEMRSGIQQVTQNYAATLSNLADVYLVRFDRQNIGLEFQRYTSARSLEMEEAKELRPEQLIKTSHVGVCFVPEVPLHSHLTNAHLLTQVMRAHNYPVFALVHDLIPWTHPLFYSEREVRAFNRYLKWCAENCITIAISEQTRASFEDWRNHNYALARELQPPALLVSNGVEKPSSSHKNSGSAPKNELPHILMVSTVEPRKNQLLLCRTVGRIERTLGIKVELELVGSDRGYDQDYVQQVKAAVESKPHWKLSVDLTDSEVDLRYRSADMTCYPSEVEGFGLPVLESIIRGTPCVTTDHVPTGSAPGCIQVPVEHLAETLPRILEDLITDKDRLNTLRKSCRRAQVQSWETSAEQLLSEFRNLRGAWDSQ